MAVGLDTFSESHTGTTGNTSSASFTWNHSGGTPEGVVVFAIGLADAEKSTSVTYGGVSCPAVSGGSAHEAGSQPGRCTAYFLGSGVPTGTQAIIVNRTNDATVMCAYAYTVTALTDTEVYTAGIALVQSTGVVIAEQNVDDGSPGTNSMRFAGIRSGLTSVPAAGANSTYDGSIGGHSIDFGADTAACIRETTAGQGSRPVGWSGGASNEQAAVHLAIREVVSAATLAWKVGAIHV